jgi:NADH-quinone oxidoreductase subunit M
MLWAFQRMMFGPLQNEANKGLKDLNARELAYLLPLVLFAFWMGIYPKPFLDRINPSVDAFVARMETHFEASPYACGDDCLPSWLAKESH